MQLHALVQTDGDTHAEFGARARQIVIEPIVVDLDLIAADEFVGVGKTYVGLAEGALSFTVSYK